MATNYQVNPNFATDTTGLANEGAGVISQVADVDFVAGTAMQIVATATNDGASMTAVDPISIPGLGAASAIWTFKFDVQLQAGTNDVWYVQASLLDNVDNGLGGVTEVDSIITPTGTVTTNTVTFEVNNASADAIRLFFWKLANTGAATVRISNLQLLGPETGMSTALRLTRSNFELRPAY
jgi:hypothetical protein